MARKEVIGSKDENNSNREEKKANIEESTENFVVKKGRGTPLKYFPTVVAKLSEKIHSCSTTLHYILYGEHDEVDDAKKDVLEFSGFVSDSDEGNQRDLVKERLSKCTTDMLAQLCSIFGIPVYGMMLIQKKEMIELLFDFLEAPHDTIEEAKSSDREIRERKRKLKITEVSYSEKLTKSVWELEKSNRKQKSAERRLVQGGDKPPKEWYEPSCEEVQKAIYIILEKIDITTATFSDVLEELDEHFEMDTSPRKDAIKTMIGEELYRLADEAQEKTKHRTMQCKEEHDAKQDEIENCNEIKG